MVPEAMVALVATAVSMLLCYISSGLTWSQLYAALKEWQSGRWRRAEFSASLNLDTYIGHGNTMDHLDITCKNALEVMLSDIYTKARCVRTFILHSYYSEESTWSVLKCQQHRPPQESLVLTSTSWMGTSYVPFKVSTPHHQLLSCHCTWHPFLLVLRTDHSYSQQWRQYTPTTFIILFGLLVLARACHHSLVSLLSVVSSQLTI